MFLTPSRVSQGIATLATLMLMGCTPDATAPFALPSSPSVAETGSGGGSQVVTLCKIGPVGTTATFTVAAASGWLPYGDTVTVGAQDLASFSSSLCRTVWVATETGVVVDVTVTEIAASGGAVFSRIWTWSDVDLASLEILAPAAPTVTVRADYTRGAFVQFTNVVGPPPPPSLSGCTPGYWKQRQHFDSWPAGVTPSTPFASIFANAFPGRTLLQVLGHGGGGLYALGRHTVAAYLSAGTVDYGMTQAQVVAAFNAAYASGDYGPLHTQFETYNERGCPLN